MSEAPDSPVIQAAPAARRSRQARVAWGAHVVTVGGDAPVRVQSMTNTDTVDVIGTAIQVKELAIAGSEMVRITVNTPEAADAVPAIREQLDRMGINVPLIGDFHYNGHRLLTEHPACAEALSKYRINPGNVGKGEKRDRQFGQMIEAACRWNKPVRIGVNWGSLDQELLAQMMDDNSRRSQPWDARQVMYQALIQSALQSAEAAREMGMDPNQIIISCKVSGVQDLISVYQGLAERCDYPLHLGLTEAGMGTKGTVASAAALSVLLQQGIGDTIRVSLTPQPGEARTQEVVVALEILQALGLRSFNPSVTACPGCGRTTSTTFQELAKQIDDFLRAQMPVWRGQYAGVENLKVAVMGCIVNGPGESKHADIGISLPGTGEAPAAPVFIDGEKALTLRGDNIAAEFHAIVENYIRQRFGQTAQPLPSRPLAGASGALFSKMSEALKAVKGMNDILPPESARWEWLEARMRSVLQRYGYQNVRTPIVEPTALFVRGIGEVTDIVEKEMYAFEDRADKHGQAEHLALRPEMTAGVVRAMIEHAFLRDSGRRLYYFGPMFRRERPQKGRYRQFHQMGIEALGFHGPDVDAEVILLGARLLKELGLVDGEHVRLELNCLGELPERRAHREALIAHLEAHKDLLDEDGQRRLYTNPLRVLDTKNPALQDMANAAPKLLDFLGEASRAHFNGVRAILDAAGIRYTINPRLVRGLDYYNLTVFEWITDKLGAQGTVCGGGRYDGLIEQLGGKPTPAVGFGMGLERMLLLLEEVGVAPAAPVPDAYAIVPSAEGLPRVMVALEALREAGVSVVLHPGQSSMKSQFKKADASGARHALIFGPDELAAGQVAVKALRDAAAIQHLRPLDAVADWAPSLRNA